MVPLTASIPQPPVTALMPRTAEIIFSIIAVIPLVAALYFALRRLRAGLGPILIYCLAGGLVACALEPIVDVLGLCYNHERGAISVFSILDRRMPLYIPFVYAWYVGGLGYFASRLYARGVTKRMMFTFWMADGVVDLAVETPGILMHTYGYYGQQPLDFWGFPIWWAFVNPIMPMAAGALIYKMLPHMDARWKLGAVIAIIPMADGLANGATAWPMWAVLNQRHVSWVSTYVGCVACLTLSLIALWIITAAVSVSPAAAGVRSLKDVLRGAPVQRDDQTQPLFRDTHRESVTSRS